MPHKGPSVFYIKDSVSFYPTESSGFSETVFFHFKASSRQPAMTQTQEVSQRFHNLVWSLRLFNVSSVTKNDKQNYPKILYEKNSEVHQPVASCCCVAGEPLSGTASRGTPPPQCREASAPTRAVLQVRAQPSTFNYSLKEPLSPLPTSERKQPARLGSAFATTSSAFLNSCPHFS